MGKLELIILTC